MAVGPPQAHHLFHRRTARRFPRAGARSRGRVPHAHRAQADRRARRGQAPERHRPLRTRVLLRVLAAGAAAGEPAGGEGPAPLAQPVADLGRVRTPHVLSALRARILCAGTQALPQRGTRARDDARRRKGGVQRHLQRPRHSARHGRRDARRSVRRPQVGDRAAVAAGRRARRRRAGSGRRRRRLRQRRGRRARPGRRDARRHARADAQGDGGTEKPDPTRRSHRRRGRRGGRRSRPGGDAK